MQVQWWFQDDRSPGLLGVAPRGHRHRQAMPMTMQILRSWTCTRQPLPSYPRPTGLSLPGTLGMCSVLGSGIVRGNRDCRSIQDMTCGSIPRDPQLWNFLVGFSWPGSLCCSISVVNQGQRFGNTAINGCVMFLGRSMPGVVSI